MAGITPLETLYNGYRFRSRLEARWAVFFDALGIEYRYEPEGYGFRNGQNYLPDFWLPTWKSFFEVKPELPTHEEQEKCRLLNSATEGKAVICSMGAPGAKFPQLLVFDFLKWFDKWDEEVRQGYADPEENISVKPGEFAWCRRGEHVCLYVHDEDFNWGSWDCFDKNSERCGDRLPVGSDILTQAINASRAARFGT